MEVSQFFTFRQFNFPDLRHPAKVFFQSLEMEGKQALDGLYFLIFEKETLDLLETLDIELFRPPAAPDLLLLPPAFLGPEVNDDFVGSLLPAFFVLTSVSGFISVSSVT